MSGLTTMARRVVGLGSGTAALLAAAIVPALPTSSAAQETETIVQPIRVHDNCNEGQRSRMERAIAVAERAVVAASREVREDSPFFRTWFGEWSEGNGEVVRYYLDRVAAAWDGIELRCGGGPCNDANPPFAFYQPRAIIADKFTVCHRWHGLPPLSVERDAGRAGLVVNEVSHGVGTPGTMDVKDLGSCSSNPDSICYGADNARNLARDPTCLDVGDVDWIRFDARFSREQFFKTDDTCKALYNAENYDQFVSDVFVNLILVVTG